MKIQFIKFAIVGLASTGIHSIIYLLFLRITNATPQLANIIGFMGAFMASYFGQRFWTFNEVKINNERKSQIKFFSSALFSYMLNSFWVWLIEKQIKTNPEYALIGIMFITPAFTFLVLKLWVFKDES
jgi:putative flippase GtrA